MVEIRGTYVYDDALLTPGRSKDGGLHQNLFDADGNLTASARFIPDAPEPSTDLASLDEVGIASLSRSDVTESDALGELVVLVALSFGVRYALPWAGRAWKTARKAITERRERRVDESRVVEGVIEDVDPPGAELAQPQEEMSRQEAEHRLRLAIAAREFSQSEVQRLLAARIVDADADLPDVIAAGWSQLSLEQRAEWLAKPETDDLIRVQRRGIPDDDLQRLEVE